MGCTGAVVQYYTSRLKSLNPSVRYRTILGSALGFVASRYVQY